MSDFDWMQSPSFPVRKDATRSTREDEIYARAHLLARLGVPKKEAERRIKAKLAWEYERLGKPIISKRVSSVVSAAYKRAN